MGLFKSYKFQIPKLISMSEEEAWQIYNEMSHIQRIKELFELRRQLAYMECAADKGQESVSWGKVQNIEEIIGNMEESQQRLADLQQKTKELSHGYQSSVEN
jgi:hypothetical protein